jgi:predicted HTH domain antitoxin
MITIAFDFDPGVFSALRLAPIDPGVFSALRLAPIEFAREMRLAASIHWYAQGRLSQGRAAELADVSRAEFIEELFHRKVPACQSTFEDIVEELKDE